MSLRSCLQRPLPSGPAPDPGTSPAAVAVEPGPPARRLQEGGPTSRAVWRASGPPPPPELQVPTRLLALHRELARSLHSGSWVSTSPPEL